jgi:hypothetical protein
MSGESQDSDVEFVAEQRQPAPINNVSGAKKSESKPRASIFPHYIFMKDETPTRVIRSFFKNDTANKANSPVQRSVSNFLNISLCTYIS